MRVMTALTFAFFIHIFQARVLQADEYPLHEAAKAGRTLQETQQLLAGGAKIDARDAEQKTPLDWALHEHTNRPFEKCYKKVVQLLAAAKAIKEYRLATAATVQLPSTTTTQPQ